MQTAKTIVFWIVIVFSAFLLWQVVRTGSSAPAEPEVSYSTFLARVAGGEVQKVTITCNLVRAVDGKGGIFLVTAPSNHATMLEVLQQHGVEIWFRDSPGWPTWALYVIPLLLLAALWVVVLSQRQRIRRLESAGRTPMS
jgi:ATP-dependent Zn protease